MQKSWFKLRNRSFHTVPQLRGGSQVPPTSLTPSQLTPAARPSDTDGCSDLFSGAARNPLPSRTHLSKRIYAINPHRSPCHTSNLHRPFIKLGRCHLTTNWTGLSSPWPLDSSPAHSTSLGPQPHPCLPGSVRPQPWEDSSSGIHLIQATQHISFEGCPRPTQGGPELRALGELMRNANPAPKGSESAKWV